MSLAWHIDGGTTSKTLPGAAGVNAENQDVEMAHDVSDRSTSGLGVGNDGVAPEGLEEDGAMTGW